MSEQIQIELSEYRTLTNDEEKTFFWERVRIADAQLPREDRSLINQVVYDDLQKIIVQTKDLLRRVELARSSS